jgi:acyl-CoA reductase-like NAD-dependent aldehyde dehydrogenase
VKQENTVGQYFITPGYEHTAAGELANVVNPATLQIVGQRLVTDDATIRIVIEKANSAQQGWGQLDTKTRARALHQIADSIERTDPNDAAVLMTNEMGKPYPESIGEIANCGAIFRYYAEMARDDAGKVAGTTQAGSLQYSRYHPLGVSVHIMPFNFPVLLMCWTVAASLAAGNACIVKPAEATSLCTLEFMKHFEILPAGLVSCLPGDARVAQTLISSKDTHAVAFTGSVAAGCEVGAACARMMKPCVIENGGSDPMIISSHAPMDVAVAGSVTSAFHLSGQVCTSSERFFVVDEVHDEFVSKFALMTRQLRVGNGMAKSEIGPLVSEAARTNVERLVSDAIEAGATLICGGRRPPEIEAGWFYEPTILTDITPDMSIMHEECFGPVAAICRVVNFEEALARANDTEFGLGAAIFTTNLAEAMEATERFQSGLVWVNNPLIDNDALPFGGWKMSGLGKELGRQGLDAFRRQKMVIIDHQPKIHDWWYPYPDNWFYADGGRKLED